MRVVVLGGTRFIGRAVVEELTANGDDVLVVHRGRHEPNDWPSDLASSVEHLHSDRATLATHAVALLHWQPDAAVETYAVNAVSADIALDALPADIRLVTMSSGDVYRAYESLHASRHTDEIPLREDAPLRERRFVDGDEYENLEVEERYLARGATVLRLAAVYGPHDYQRRHEFVIRRIRAGRKRIPIGSGTFRFGHVSVADVAAATRLVLAAPPPSVRGEVFNLCEQSTPTYFERARRVIDVLESDAELISVSDDTLPADLTITGAFTQDLVTDATKARGILGWQETDPRTALQRAARWELDHPPKRVSDDFSDDEAALAAAVTP